MPEIIPIVADFDLSDWNKGVQQLVRDDHEISDALQNVTDNLNEMERAINDVSGAINVDVNVDGLQQAISDASTLSDTDIELQADIGRLPFDRLENDVDSLSGRDIELETDVQGEEVAELLAQIRDLQVIDIAINVVGNLPQILEQMQNLPGVSGIIELNQAVADFERSTGVAYEGLDDMISTLRSGGLNVGRDEITAIAAQLYSTGVAFEDLEATTLAVFNTAQANGQDVNETLKAMRQLVDTGLADGYAEAGDVITAGFQSGANRAGDFLEVLDEYASTFATMGLNAEGAVSVLNSGLSAGTGNADRAADAFRELGIRIRESGEEGADFNDEVTDALERIGATDEALAFRSGTLSGEDFLFSITSGLASITDEAERAQAAVALFGTQAEDLGVDVVGQINATEDLGDVEGRAQEAADVMTSTIGGAIETIQTQIDELATAFFDAMNLDEWLADAQNKMQELIQQLRDGRSLGDALEIALEIPGLSDSMDDLATVFQDVGLALLEAFQGVLRLLNNNAAADALTPTIQGLAGRNLVSDIISADDANEVTRAIQAAIARGLSPDEIRNLLNEGFTGAVEGGNLAGAQAVIDAFAGTQLSEGLENRIREDVQNFSFGGANERRDALIRDVALELNIDEEQARQQFLNIQNQVLADTDLTALEFNTEGLGGQINETAKAIRDQLNVALASGDFDSAQILMRDLGTTLEQEFDNALTAGDFDVAALIAEQLNNAGLSGVVADAAIEAGFTPEQTQGILASADTIVNGVSTISTNFEESAARIGEAALMSTENISAYSDSVVEDSDRMRAGYNNFVDSFVSKTGEISVAVAAAKEAIAGLRSAYDELPSSGAVTPGEQGAIGGSATGGTFSGTNVVGENGRELVSTDTRLAVLNNQTTESVLSGLMSLMTTGNLGGMTSTRNVNVNQTNNFYTQGAAQDTASAQRVANTVRGY